MAPYSGRLCQQWVGGEWVRGGRLWELAAAAAANFKWATMGAGFLLPFRFFPFDKPAH